MKVLHVISQRPDATGSGIYLQALLKEAHAGGHENFLIAGIPADKQISVMPVPENHFFPVYFETPENPGPIVGMSDVMPYPSRRFRDLDNEEIAYYLKLFTGQIKQVITKHQPAIIHSNHLWLATTAACHAAAGLPVFATCHGSDLRQFQQCPHLRERVASGCRNLKAIFAVNAEQKNEISNLMNLPPDSISVVGSGFHEKYFYPPKDGLKPSLFTILYAGKLSRAKGVIWLLKALLDLRNKPFHFHLVGNGSGEEYQDCRALADLLGDKTTCHGQVSQNRLATLLRQSHLFVLPSMHEGLPLVILEALACGCTIIATDLPGTREIERRLSRNHLTLLPKPEIIDLDRTILRDELLFINTIKSAISRHLDSHASAVLPEPGLVSFSWASVFQKIEQKWHQFI